MQQDDKNKPIEEPNILNNISSKIQSGGKTIKEKISSIFKRKKASPKKEAISKGNGDGLSNNNKQDKKKTFNIQLSEEDKDNVYDINDDEEEEDEEDDKQQNKEMSNQLSNNNMDKNQEEDNNESIKNERPNDTDMICHYLFSKGTIIDINEIESFQFIKVKAAKKGVLSIFGFGSKSTTTIEKSYLSFFDENYLYFLKDIQCDPKNPSYRRIGNKFNLFQLYNALFDLIENDIWQITLEFKSQLSSSEHIMKTLYFNNTLAKRFYDSLNYYFQKLNMQISNNNG